MLAWRDQTDLSQDTGNLTERGFANIVSIIDQLRPALERRDRSRLNDLIAQLVTLGAPMGGQWERLAIIAAHNGELGLARRAIDLFVEANRGQPSAQYQKAGLLMNMGAWQDAYALLRSLPDDRPSPLAQAFSQGTCALHLGETAEARRQLDRATELDPRSGSAWYNLSLAVDLASEPALAGRLIAAGPGMAGAPPMESASYQYSLGRLHAGRGEPDLAFAAFSHGARQMKAVLPYDRDVDSQWAANAVSEYSAQRIAALTERQREPTDRTIFVTGLPRSGTTLVEQILTSHSTISDGGELGRLGLLAHDMGGPHWSALDRHVELHGAASAARLWHHWLDERFPGSARVIDKTLDGSRFLGMAAALLPDAPLIWMTRDPLECAWSCFRTCFRNIAWSNDLEDIAHHFRLEDRLRQQWQQILGDRLLVVPYEALIAEPEDWIRKIILHCRLTEETQLFAPHENRRTVTTTSMMQVRRPINRDGIGAAEPYRQYLAPFIQAYYD